MNTRSIQRALNGGVPHSHNGAELSRGKISHVHVHSIIVLLLVEVLLWYTLPVIRLFCD